MRAVLWLVLFLGFMMALGAFFCNNKNSQPKKPFNVYMNEPLNVSGLDITVTDVKEAKKIKNIKAKNTFLQVFVTVKNTKSIGVNMPRTIAVIHRQDDNWICLLDNRFKNGSEKIEYVGPLFLVDPKDELKAQMVFDCDAYLNEKAGDRKSKPSDFKLFMVTKEKDGGYIFLEKRP